MGCAGSNPMPASGDTMGPLKMANTNNEPNQPCSIAQKMVVDNINKANIDDVVKKIQDITGSMENLMGDTQEKLGSLFGKVEQKAEDVKETIENNVNDTASIIPENPTIHEVILLTTVETKVIPIDEVKLEMLKNRSDSVFEEVTNETKEEQTEIKIEEAQNEEIEKQNEGVKIEENEKNEGNEEIEKQNEGVKIEENEKSEENISKEEE